MQRTQVQFPTLMSGDPELHETLALEEMNLFMSAHMSIVFILGGVCRSMYMEIRHPQNYTSLVSFHHTDPGIKQTWCRMLLLTEPSVLLALMSIFIRTGIGQRCFSRIMMAYTCNPGTSKAKAGRRTLSSRAHSLDCIGPSK